MQLIKQRDELEYKMKNMEDTAERFSNIWESQFTIMTGTISKLLQEISFFSRSNKCPKNLVGTFANRTGTGVDVCHQSIRQMVSDTEARLKITFMNITSEVLEAHSALLKRYYVSQQRAVDKINLMKGDVGNLMDAIAKDVAEAETQFQKEHESIIELRKHLYEISLGGQEEVLLEKIKQDIINQNSQMNTQRHKILNAFCSIHEDAVAMLEKHFEESEAQRPPIEDHIFGSSLLIPSDSKLYCETSKISAPLFSESLAVTDPTWEDPEDESQLPTRSENTRPCNTEEKNTNQPNNQPTSFLPPTNQPNNQPTSFFPINENMKNSEFLVEEGILDRQLNCRQTPSDPAAKKHLQREEKHLKFSKPISRANSLPSFKGAFQGANAKTGVGKPGVWNLALSMKPFEKQFGQQIGRRVQLHKPVMSNYSKQKQ